MPDWPALVEALDECGIRVPDLASARPVGGGDISAAWHIQSDRGSVFLKTGGREFYDAFAAEAEGLSELQRSNTVRVPDVLAVGEARSESFLALEWLELGAHCAADDRLLGTQLALLHSHSADRFGWKRDNWIGRTPQINRWSTNWLNFYRDHRLNYQLETAERNGFGAVLNDTGAELAQNLPAFFTGYDPVPSLLHGDLWGGNRSTCDGNPVVFDPAVYYGDRESDLALTRLFGGFSMEFYRAYEESWPLAPGHEKRLILYQLYHVLNHLNLFGHTYLSQACALINKALAAIR